MATEGFNEQEVLVSLASDDVKAFQLLFNQRIFPFVSRYIPSVPLAEDLTQEVFIKIWDNRKNLVEVQSFKTYLFVSARNDTLNSLKKTARTDVTMGKVLREYAEERKYHGRRVSLLWVSAIHQPGSGKTASAYPRNVSLLPRVWQLVFLLLNQPILTMKTNNLTSQRRFEGSYFSNSTKNVLLRFSLVALSCLVFACSKNEVTEPMVSTTASKSSTAETQAVSPYISVGNVTSGKLEVYSYSYPDWNVSGALHWAFEPTTALGFSSTGSTYFNGPTDAKVHYNSAFSGATSVAAITDNSWAGLVTYEGSTPRGTKLWGKYWTDGPGIHSGELLPNGNMALAAADADWVRVYNTTLQTGANYAEFPIVFAHAVLWDPAYNRLWVNGVLGGQHVITALIVGGTRTAPTLTEDTAYRSVVPGYWTHDLAPYFGDVNKLWVSDNQGVYIFNKVTKTFTNSPGSTFRTYVKGISNQTEGGYIIETKGNNTYTTTVDFFNLTTGAAAGSRSKTGQSFYKGKVFTRAYQ